MMNRDHLTVAVHGSTGTQGAAVVRALLAAGHRVRALARKPASPTTAGAEAVPADFDDPASLARAYAGVDAVFVQLPIVFAAERAVPQAEAVLAALARSGVGRVVVNPGTLLPPVEVGVPYVDARVRLIRELTDGPYAASVVAPAAQYLENLSAPWSAARILADGVLAYPLPADLPVPWVALDDIGAAVVEVLTRSPAKPMTVVSGPTALTGPETAAALADAMTQPVRWQTISGEEYRKMLVPYLSNKAAAGIGAMYESILSGQAPPPSAPDPRVVRTGTTTVAQWAAGQSWTDR